MTNLVYVTIANGASLSSAINLNNKKSSAQGVGGDGQHPCLIEMPSAWTAANLTFQASVDGSTYYDLYDSSGNEVTVIAAASQTIALSISAFAGVRFLKIRSGTSAIAVNQGADRVMVIGLRVV